jgi:prevent-host-death family protein
MAEVVGSQSVGVEELRRSLDKILDGVREQGREVLITRQGKPAAVLIDVERYLEVQAALREFSDPAYLAALLEARREIRAGEGMSAEEVFAQKGL